MTQPVHNYPRLHSVTHSGQTFVSPGPVLSRGCLVPLWPIEEYLVRTKHSDGVRARIKRLNPKGKPEGELPRGYNPAPRNYHFATCTIGPRVFIAKFGKEAYRALPKAALIHNGHRKGIAERYIVEAGLR